MCRIGGLCVMILVYSLRHVAYINYGLLGSPNLLIIASDCQLQIFWVSRTTVHVKTCGDGLTSKCSGSKT